MSSEIKSLQDFYGELSEVGLRLQHQFQIQFAPGPEIQFSNSDFVKVLENVSYYAESSSIPGRTQNTVQVPYLGFNFKLPTNVQFEESINVNLRCDTGKSGIGSIMRNALIDWANYHSKIDRTIGIADGLSNGGGSKRIPTSSVYMHLLNQELNTIIETYKLVGVIPGNIGAMSLANGSSDVSTFELSLIYQYFTVNLGQ